LYRAGRIIGGPAAHLYKELAQRLRPQRYETDDIVVRELTEATHMHPSTLRRALHTLEDELGDVKLTNGGQGAPTWRVTFVRMGGPVLMAAFSDLEPPGAPRGSTPRAERAKFDDKPRAERAKSADQHFAQSARSSDKPRAERAKFDDEHYVSNVLEEDSSSSDADDVAVYLEWYAHEYPQWHYGAPAPRITEQRRAYVEELLEGMPLRRLQLMTLVMFVIPREARGTGPRRPGESENDRMFIARPDNDHSLTVLYMKAPFLAREVAERKLEDSDKSLDTLADALRHQAQDAEPASSDQGPNTPTHDDPATSESVHDAHWPAVCDP
jgi:hypothetical protein